MDAYLHNVRTDNLHSAVFSVDKASVKEMTLVSDGVKSSEIVSGAMLVQNKVLFYNVCLKDYIVSAAIIIESLMSYINLISTSAVESYRTARYQH